jgi:uncharacterized membrane protein
MKHLLGFFKATLIGGLLVVLPLQLAILLAGAALKNVRVLIAPIASLLPAAEDGTEGGRGAAAAIILVALCFLVGFVIRTTPGRSVWAWLDRKILDRLPFYRTLGRLMRQFANVEETSAFRPALVETPLGTRVLAFIVDEQPNGDPIVLLPNAPTPLVGELHWVPRARVHELAISTRKAIECISEFGAGAGRLLVPEKRTDVPR